MPPRSIYKLKPTAVQQQRVKLNRPYNPRNQQGKLGEKRLTRIEETFKKLDKPVVLRIPSKYRQPVTKKPPEYRGLYKQPKVGP